METSKKKMHLLISAYVIQVMENTCRGCEIQGIYIYIEHFYKILNQVDLIKSSNFGFTGKLKLF